MAIVDSTAPELIVQGLVTRETARKPFEGQDRGHTLSVETATGPVRVNFKVDATVARPPVGTFVALVVSVFESREFGASFNVARVVNADDLDKIVSAAGLGGEQRKAS